jgi:hypothetical protein
MCHRSIHRLGSWPARIRIFFELFKSHLTGFIALSAVFGQMIAAGIFSRETLVAGGGVWLLAAGAAVLNNIQDRDHDRRFTRTRNRCLPQKTIPVRTAAVLALILAGAGLTVLFRYPDTLWPGLLGLLALLCYNGLYTPMKKKTFAAVWPGVVCGMLPPAIGWTLVPAPASAGTGQDLLMVMLVLGLWQMPHFLALRAGMMVSWGRPGVHAGRIACRSLFLVPGNIRVPLPGPVVDPDRASGAGFDLGQPLQPGHSFISHQGRHPLWIIGHGPGRHGPDPAGRHGMAAISEQEPAGDAGICRGQPVPVCVHGPGHTGPGGYRVFSASMMAAMPV